jgi:DNA-binding transcriptional LysR family regulator
MDLKRLQHVVALADEGNFGRAAARVHLSQPAFSRSIQAVENELGLKLFDRGTMEATCTPSGNFVVDRARRLLQESRMLEREVELYREGGIGDIAFGSGPLPAAAMLPALLTDLRSRHPGVSVRVQVTNPIYLIEPLRSEALDFFVGDTREVPRDGTFAIQQIGRLPAGFFARAGHPIFKRKSIRVAHMAAYRLGTGQLPAELRSMLLHLLELGADHKLPIAVECDDVQLLKCVALTTDTIIVSSELILRGEIEAGAMREIAPVDFPPGYSEIGIVSLQGRSHSPMAQHAIDFLARIAAAPG